MYWIHKDGQNHGPYTATQIREYSGPDTFVSHEGKWCNFASHPDFGAQAGSPPPPPPANLTTPSQQGHQSYDWYRVAGENSYLFVSAGVVAFLLFFFTTISLGGIFLILGIGVVFVKVNQGNILGSSVKVGNNQFPRIHALTLEAARKLNIHDVPDVFVLQDPTLNAAALGLLGKKTIYIHSGLIEALDDKELCSIIGHELAHIRLGHTTWMTLIGQAGGGIPVFSQILMFIFNGWSRKAEYSCDRAGFISCGDVNASICALAKLAVGEKLFAELDLKRYSNQKCVVDEDEVAKYSEAFCDHPFLVNRIDAIRKFADEHPELDSNGVSTVAMPHLQSVGVAV